MVGLHAFPGQGAPLAQGLGWALFARGPEKVDLLITLVGYPKKTGARSHIRSRRKDTLQKLTCAPACPFPLKSQLCLCLFAIHLSFAFSQ